MIVLKILAAPFVVVLTVLAAVVSFLFCMATAVFVVACVVLTLLAVGPVHQRPDAGRDRVPCPCVSDLSLWHPGHRGVAGG